MEMEVKLDVSRLRKDMENYYGTAMTSVSPIAMFDLNKVKQADDIELVEIAQENGINLWQYVVE